MEKIFIGCDVSKSKIDFSVFLGEKFICHREVENSTESICTFIESVLILSKDNIIAETIFAVEYTGIYNKHLIGVALLNQLKIALLHPYSIKMVNTINRDKNDKIDSMRIAEYAMRFYDKLHFAKPSPQNLDKLKALNSIRSLLIKNLSAISQSLGESKLFESKEIYKILESSTQKTLASLSKDIKLIDQKIQEIIKKDSDLNKTFKLLNSVPGIGKVTATELIIYTENFTKFENAKKLGSFCGVVPFERSSGIFKGKNRVSKKANKSLKTLLHLGAMSTIKTNSNFAEYYNRKVLEGKNKMSAINAVRNKILSTAFAVVTSGKIYQKEYVYNSKKLCG